MYASFRPRCLPTLSENEGELSTVVQLKLNPLNRRFAATGNRNAALPPQDARSTDIISHPQTEVPSKDFSKSAD